MSRERDENAFELKQVAVRMVSAPPLVSEEPMNTPEAAIRIMAKELKGYDREVVCVINLKNNLEPINFSIVSMGALDQTIVHPRELLKNVILSNASSILLVHTHPSGKLVPSKEDVEITDRIGQICNLLGVKLLDHIIIGGGNDRTYYSFHEKGVMPVSAVRYVREVEGLKWEQNLGGLRNR